MTTEALPVEQMDGNADRRRGTPPMIAILSVPAPTEQPGPQLPDLAPSACRAQVGLHEPADRHPAPGGLRPVADRQ